MCGIYSKAFRAALALTVLSLVQGRFAAAQNRINDKDLEGLMKNLRDDAKSFQPTFNSAISKSTIRKTSREKDAKNLVASFIKQTDAALNNFKKTRKADANVQNVMSTGQQIDKLAYGLNLGGQTASKWDKIRTELQQVAGAFGLPALSAAAATPDAVSIVPCIQAVGAARSKQLVDECLAVSPATHAPCNAQNSCVLILDEIKRGCSMLRQGAPAFCSEYTKAATNSVENQQTVSCYSDDGRRRYCDADTRRGVQLIRQRSGAPCQQGYSWDYDTSGIWVDHGCRADFRVD
ncbi:MAG: DUF3011 domain-containing protein [Bryobacteraceae bacterium]